jgi:hypothetical protein
MKTFFSRLVDAILVASVLGTVVAFTLGFRVVGTVLIGIATFVGWKRRELQEGLCDFALHGGGGVEDNSLPSASESSHYHDGGESDGGGGD